MAKADFNDPKVQMAFARMAWAQLAPFAYARYLVNGRGCIYIEAANITTEEVAQGAQIDCDSRYVTIDDLIIPVSITDRMTRYDPESEVFFVFDTGEGLSTFYGRNGDAPSPQELYEADLLVKDLWQTIAPYAYQHFLEKGRGGVVIVPTIVQEEGTRTLHLDKPHQYLATDTDVLSDTAAKELQQYNPRTAVVFLLDFGSGLKAYRRTLAGQPSPKELYKRRLTDLTDLVSSATGDDLIIATAPSSIQTEPIHADDKILYKGEIYKVITAERLEQAPPYTFRFTCQKI